MSAAVKIHPELLGPTKAKLDAEASKANAEARSANAEADHWELNTKLAALELEKQERTAAITRHQDLSNHTYLFFGEVSNASSAGCQAMLSSWSRKDPGCDMEIVFNSPGGSVIAGMALFDKIVSLRAAGHKITTTCRGYAASMAGILLQAGSERVIGPESYLMIHELSAYTGGKIGEIEDAVKFYQKIGERVSKIFVERSEGKCSPEVFKAGWTRQDWWLSSNEAFDLGFVDDIR